MDIYALSIIFITHIGMNDPLSDEIWPLSESQGIPDIQNGIFFFICLKNGLHINPKSKICVLEMVHYMCTYR